MTEEQIASLFESELIYQEENFLDVGDYEQKPYTQVGDIEMKVDVYDGIDGKGFVVEFKKTIDGVIYYKSINYGSETHRNIDWHENII